MKKSLLILLTFGLTQTSCVRKSSGDKIKLINDLMQAYVKLNKFNGTILIAQEDKLLFEKGYGYKNTETKILNDKNSIFQIYSVTKTFTSTMIFKLIELNKLSINDKLSKFYPSFPKGDSITIENLLTHTSGLYDYTHENNMTNHSEDSLLALLAKKPLDFSPGTSWSYSNSGFCLLGFIIKKITGMSYEKAIRHYIFTPLQMTHSGFDFKNLTDTNKTTGYTVFSEGIKKEAALEDSTGPFAAGAIYSTVGDLYKYHVGLQSYNVINKESLTKAYAASDKNENYGHGWQLSSLFFRKKVVFHGGGATGYRSIFFRIPEENTCIVLLNNNENANLEFVANKIYDVLYDKDVALPSEIKLDKNIISKYTGTFTNSNIILYTSITDGRLAIQVSGQNKSTLLAQKENYFSQEEANAYVEFPKNNKGEYNEIIVHQRGPDIHANRIYSCWGLLGNATSIGWDGPDIKFTEDVNKKGLWLLLNVKLSTGELKFRFNNDWNINYGDNKNDKALDLYGENIKIIEAGTYDIILDLTNEVKPNYSILKKL
jgi:CubicO group peptidase (beta-lactamase class C family)